MIELKKVTKKSTKDWNRPNQETSIIMTIKKNKKYKYLMCLTFQWKYNTINIVSQRKIFGNSKFEKLQLQDNHASRISSAISQTYPAPAAEADLEWPIVTRYMTSNLKKGGY